MVTDLLRFLMAETMARHSRRSGSGTGRCSSRQTTEDRPRSSKYSGAS